MEWPLAESNTRLEACHHYLLTNGEDQGKLFHFHFPLLHLLKDEGSISNIWWQWCLSCWPDRVAVASGSQGAWWSMTRKSCSFWLQSCTLLTGKNLIKYLHVARPMKQPFLSRNSIIHSPRNPAKRKGIMFWLSFDGKIWFGLCPSLADPEGCEGEKYE